MPEFRCRDVGAECDARLEGADVEDVLRQVAEHLKSVHNVARPTQTIMNYLAMAVK